MEERRVRAAFRAPEGRYVESSRFAGDKTAYSSVSHPCSLAFFGEPGEDNNSNNKQHLIVNTREKAHVFRTAPPQQQAPTPQQHDESDSEQEELPPPALLKAFGTLSNGRHQPTALSPIVGMKGGGVVAVGYTTGEVMLVSVPSSQLLATLNSHGAVHEASVQQLAWVPNTAGNRLLVVHTDGKMFEYDRKRSEQCALPPTTAKKSPERVDVEKQKGGAKANPIARWSVGTHGVSAVAFSPDGTKLATVGRDGCLRIIDFEAKKLIVGFHSYYGGLHCVCWCPAGQLVMAGGEDDMLTLWDWQERSVVARCVGHESWVTSVACDGYMDESNPEAFRIVTGGQDTQLVLWDFSYDNIIPPKRTAQPSVRGGSSVLIPAPNRDEVAYIEPVVAVAVHADPVSDVALTPHHVVTCSVQGEVKLWARPPPESLPQANEGGENHEGAAPEAKGGEEGAGHDPPERGDGQGREAEGPNEEAL